MGQGQLGIVITPVYFQSLEPALVGHGEEPGKFDKGLALDRHNVARIHAVGSKGVER